VNDDANTFAPVRFPIAYAVGSVPAESTAIRMAVAVTSAADGRENRPVVLISCAEPLRRFSVEIDVGL